jgi:hypothetical protein
VAKKQQHLKKFTLTGRHLRLFVVAHAPAMTLAKNHFSIAAQ